MAADGAPLVIREAEGSTRLELSLAGSDLPDQGVPFGAAQRLVTTRYPGSALSSTQVMGTEEHDIVLSGVFNDVLATGRSGLGGAAGHALAQTARCRELLLRQRLCELEWGDTLVRTGYVREFEPEIVRDSLIRYRLVFQVASAAEPEQISPTPFDVPDTTGLLAELAKAEDRVDAVEQVARALAEVGILSVPSSL